MKIGKPPTMIIGRGSAVLAEVVEAINELPGTRVVPPVGVSSSKIYQIERIIHFQLMSNVDAFNIFALVEIAPVEEEGSDVAIGMMMDTPKSLDETQIQNALAEAMTRVG